MPAGAASNNFLELTIGKITNTSKDCANGDKKSSSFSKIVQTINALVNSGGGTLIVHYDDRPTREEVNKHLRKLEQKIRDFLGTRTLVYGVKIINPESAIEHQEYKIEVESSTKKDVMTTLSYNICLPSNQHVMEVLPIEDLQTVRAILNETNPSVEPTEPDSYHRCFVKDDVVAFLESKKIQFKYLSDEETSNSSFAARLAGKGNKFPCYVSAFANDGGGHMYVGIQDNGKVIGEKLSEDEMQKVRKKIETAINKMVWPERYQPKNRGDDDRWEVHFVPVKDGNNAVMPDLYVVVVFVAQCLGGVFAAEPECYEIIDKKVKKMDFASWKKRIIDPDLAVEEKYSSDVPIEIVYEMLMTLVNNNSDVDQLTTASKKCQDEYKKIEVELVCLSKFVSHHLRKGDYKTAKKMLKEYRSAKEKLPAETTNTTLFKVMEQYLRIVMKRCKGSYDESYENARDCLNDLKDLAPCITSAKFYVQIATLENILAIKKAENREEMLSFIQNAKENYDEAEHHLDTIRGSTTTKAEYKKKIFIYRALLHLGCSLAGDILSDDFHELINVKKAKEYLMATQNLILEGYPLNKFRKIQYLFAQACLYYRLHTESNNLLEEAATFAREAKTLAEECKFVEMEKYARKEIPRFLREQISLNARGHKQI